MRLILGTMSFNLSTSSYNPNTDELNQMLNYYRNYLTSNNLLEDAELDTARYYNNESLLSKCDIKGLKIATKANPWYNNDFTNGKLGQLSPSSLAQQFNKSLDDLEVNSCDIFYLHAPDHETYINETLKECDRLYRNEKFKYLGLSNYSDKQVLQILDKCENNGYITPKYYQGMFNPICQNINGLREILSEYRIHFNAYNILAGGLLTGKYNLDDPNSVKGRYCDNSIYQNIFWKEPIIRAVKMISNTLATDKEQSLIDYTFSWLKYHANLNREDGIILGASSLTQLRNNLDSYNNAQPLSNEQIRQLNNIWEKIKDHSPDYYY